MPTFSEPYSRDIDIWDNDSQGIDSLNDQTLETDQLVEDEFLTTNDKRTADVGDNGSSSDVGDNDGQQDSTSDPMKSQAKNREQIIPKKPPPVGRRKRVIFSPNGDGGVEDRENWPLK